MEHEFKQGDHIVFESGKDYGFWYVEDAPGIPGMVIVRNDRGDKCVDVTTIRKT